MSISDNDFKILLSSCQTIADSHREGIVFIRGIAIYIHVVNAENQDTVISASLAETTHDADFYISIADMADLRDEEEVTPNRRLNKHQLIKNGFEFDIYTERYSALIVPYDQIKAHAVIYDRFPVASLEHLLILKLEAYQDRRQSAKGAKDAKDIIRISYILDANKRNLNYKLIEGFIRDEHLDLLKSIEKSPEFLSLARGNAKLAKDLRTRFSKMLRQIK